MRTVHFSNLQSYTLSFSEAFSRVHSSQGWSVCSSRPWQFVPVSPQEFCRTHTLTQQNRYSPQATLRVGFWQQNGFFADISFWAAGFFRGFCRQNVSHFCGEKVSRKILQEKPRENPPKFLQQKTPTHFCRGAVPTTLGKIIKDRSYSFGYAKSWLMLQLQHQVGFPEHGWIAVTNYSYRS